MWKKGSEDGSQQDLRKKQRIIRRIIQGLVIAVVFLMAVANIAPENDIYWQLKIGEDIVRNHHFPTVDPYNLTNPNAVWTLEEWVVEVIFYVLQTQFGWWSLIILKACVITLTFGLLILILNKMRANFYLSLTALFLAAIVNTRGYWTVFPSIFEYLFIVLAFLLIEEYRLGKLRYLPFFIPLFSLVWANSHGSFFLLEGITFSYVLGSLAIFSLKKRFPNFSPAGGGLSKEQIKKMGIASFVGLFMPFVSPNGFDTWIYPFIISTSNFSKSYVNEYISFTNYIQFFSSSNFVSFAIVLFAATVFFMLISFTKINPIDLFLFAIFSFLGFNAFRHLAIFSLVALPVFIRYASIWFREYRGWLGRSLLKDVVVVILIFCFIFWYKTKQAAFGLEINMSGFPVGAADFVLQNKIKPNMFNHYNYGGFLIWKMPGYKVFIDGRLEMYLGQAGQDYLTLLEARKGWEKVVEKYHINFFLDYAATPITKELLTRDDWKLVYFDQQYVVFVKDNRENRQVIAKHYSKDIADAYKNEFMSELAQKTSSEYNSDGLKAVKNGDIISGANLFKIAVLNDPSNLVAVLNLGQAYLDGRMYQKSFEAYKYALLVDPNNQIAKKRIEDLTRFISFK